jgi:hypothetical protein
LGASAFEPRIPDQPWKNVPDGLPLKVGLPPSAVRWLDASSLWFVNAARQALEGVSAEMRGDAGVVTGLGWGSNSPVHSLIRSIHEGGFSSMNPGLFPFSVGNGPAAQTGILLGLKGPNLTLNGKEASGAAALVEAARLFASGHMDRCVAGAVDPIFPFLYGLLRHFGAPGHPPFGEGAYALALEAAEHPPEGATARLAAWTSLTTPVAPHRFGDAPTLLPRLADRLLARAGWEPTSADLIFLPADTPALRDASEAFGAARFPSARKPMFQEEVGLCGAAWAAAAVSAALALHAGKARRALLLALSTGGSAYGVALESL